MDYHDRHVVVTGGTGALGTAVVDALVAAGAHCHVPFRNDAEAERFRLRDHAQVHLVKTASLSDEDEVARLYDTVPRLWASIHTAGGFAMGTVANTAKADLLKQIDMNLVTTFLCCRAAAARISATGDGGRIVSTAARPALEWRAGAGMAAYSISKAGVAALTMAFSEEVAKDGILVNAVAPSIMDSVANRTAMPKADFTVWPKVEEVAATILFLASPENKVTRGAIVPVYGRT